jgi:predicted DsbA family dithiol-disulfide isomerase
MSPVRGAIGLAALEQVVVRFGDEFPIELHLQPFELNPDMRSEDEDLAHYASRKYGASTEDVTARLDMIRRRAAEIGRNFGPRTRVSNTFDAHRLLYWARLDGRQRELKHAAICVLRERRQPGISRGAAACRRRSQARRRAGSRGARTP